MQRYNKPLSGWTLIELLIVLAIIIVLAAIAIPKYLDLQKTARISTMQATSAAMQTTASLAYAACTLTPGCNTSAGPAGGNGLGNSITMQGTSITLAYGYPRATAAGIIRAARVDQGNLEVVTDVTGSIKVRPYGARLVQTCQVQYNQATSASTPFTVTLSTSGC